MILSSSSVTTKASKATQLQFPVYILEARTPTLAELCAQIPRVKVVKKRRPRRKNLVSAYPEDWQQISRQFKESVNYQCQECGLQCLRPDDEREHLNLSEISKLTIQCHHIDGDRWNNLPNNVRTICSGCHLRSHRGKSNPHRKQSRLFNIFEL